MHLTKGKDFSLRIRTRAMTGNLCSVGLVEDIITEDIVHNIMVADHRFIVLRRHR